MADNEIKVFTTPPDLLKRMERYPNELNGVLKTTSTASLLAIWENVPSYPTQPEWVKYRRTGQLGRSLGVGMNGGKLGSPDIFKASKVGEAYQAEFGTNLHYAPDVIGDTTQKPIFKRIGWWTMKKVAQNATRKVVEIHEAATRKMVAFLEGRG